MFRSKQPFQGLERNAINLLYDAAVSGHSILIFAIF
jgi:hypothetical protein